ncbi:MAG: dTMP kinase [Micrococcaceae bacterium]
MSIFITFEGADGSGKTTQIKLLARWLEQQGHSVLTTREPGGTTLGEELRNLLLHSGDMNAKAEALIFAAARSQHASEVMRPAVDSGTIVLCDRYIDSSAAYQGYGRRLGVQKIIDLSLWATDNFIPDLTLVLDVDTHSSQERRSARSADDRIEASGVEFMEKTRQAFLKLAQENPENHHVIDANGTVDQVFEKVVAVVQEKFPQVAS